MSEKTNEEKLQILKERLAQIKEKQDNQIITQEINEEVSQQASTETNINNSIRKNNSFSWLKYLIIIIIGSILIYIYQNLDMNKVKSDETHNNITFEEDNFILKYDFNIAGKYIVITSSFTNEDTAKSYMEKLKIKGFETNFYYLPDNSNSKEEIYEVYIGPYENLNEANQWIKNLNSEYSIIKL